MARKPLTPTECSQILNLRKTGTSLAKIAKEMHRSKTTISGFLKNPECYLSGDGKSQKELMSSPQKSNQDFIRVDYRKNGRKDNELAKPVTADDGAFTKVSLEHRAIIKFLSKAGKENRSILDSMKAVYANACPNIESIEYWAEQFKNGRELLFPSTAPKRGRGRPKKDSIKPVKTRVWVKAKTPKSRKLSKPKFSHKETNAKTSPTNKIKIKRLGSKKLLTIKFPMLKKLRDVK